MATKYLSPGWKLYFDYANGSSYTQYADVMSLTRPDREAEAGNVTTLDSTAEEFIGGNIPNNGVLTAEIYFTDAVHAALEAAISTLVTLKIEAPLQAGHSVHYSQAASYVVTKVGGPKPSIDEKKGLTFEVTAQCSGTKTTVQGS